MTDLSIEQLPINIKASQEIIALFPKAASVCNKLEALFNFHTMTAGWYGDEEQVLTLTLTLTIPNTFADYLAEQQAKKQPLVIYSDDVFTMNNSLPNSSILNTDIIIAITTTEQELIDKHKKILSALIEKKLKKVLNKFAKANQFSVI
ncbi:MAG: hypothetical protein ACSHW0_13340 [Thalassotalea sp.]